jgi:hypothetical protein
MSALNGDKSRFNRVRKQNIARRKRTRELMMKGAAATHKLSTSSVHGKPGSVSA